MELPNGWNIYNLFHVNFLKIFVSNLSKFLLNLPKVIVKKKNLVKPKQILEARIKKLKKNIFLQNSWWNGKDIFWKIPLGKKKEELFENFPKFKGIEDNTRFLKGRQCNNPLENDMGKSWRTWWWDLGRVSCKFCIKLGNC
jgi:hypothetical protein